MVSLDVRALSPVRKPFVLVLHWVVVGLFVVATVSGYRIANTGWPGQGVLGRPFMYQLHQTVGLSIIFLCVIWFVLRVSALRGFRRSMTFRQLLGGYHILLVSFGVSIAVLAMVGLLFSTGHVDILGLEKIRFDLFERRPLLVVEIFGWHKTLVFYFMALCVVHIMGAISHAIRQE